MSPISLPRIAVPGLHGRRRLPRRVHVPPREGQAATRRGLDGPRYAPRRDDDDPRSVTTSEGGAQARRRGAHTQRRGSKNVDRVRDRGRPHRRGQGVLRDDRAGRARTAVRQRRRPHGLCRQTGLGEFILIPVRAIGLTSWFVYSPSSS